MRLRKRIGTLGSFDSKLLFKDSGESTYVRHGAVIMATGGHEGATTEYGYGTSEAVMTQGELKKGLASGDIDVSEVENIVMIQCVGSRQPGRPPVLQPHLLHGSDRQCPENQGDKS